MVGSINGIKRSGRRKSGERESEGGKMKRPKSKTSTNAKGKPSAKGKVGNIQG
jgi:hypothetical protein